MSEVLQANIFFYITSVAVVIVTILLAVVLVYVLMIVRNVKDISDRLREGSKLIEGDIKAMRERIGGVGVKLQNVADFFLGRFLRKKRSSRKAKATDNNEAGD